MNTSTISGNLVREPELRVSRAGNPVVGFTIASDTNQRDEQGNWHKVGTLFVRVIVFGNLAKEVAGTIHKGTKVIVSGDLRTRFWEKDGRKGTEIELVANLVGAKIGGQDVVVQPRQSQDGYQSNDPWGSQSQNSRFNDQNNDQPPF